VADSSKESVYVRLSLVRPRAGQKDRVSKILDELVDFYATQPGYLHGYTLVSNAPGYQFGRLTFWRSERDAEATAGDQHVMARRSELLELIDGRSHIERSYTAVPHPAPEPVRP
jgi:hypothetical protein